jgi:hypothetical protein
MRLTARMELRKLYLAVFISSIVFSLLGCAGVSAPSIATQPLDRVAYLLQPALFQVFAKGSSLTYQWQKNGVNISGATSASYTTPPVSTADNGAKFTVTVTNFKGKVTSDAATLTVVPGSDASTYHYNNMRTGLNSNEQVLTKSLVSYKTFGLLGNFMVDGLVDGQPLYLANVNIPNVGPKNVLYVVTEHDSVFAFDADGANGPTTKYLWKASTVLPDETPSDNRGCSAVSPEIGITSTPVIDRARGAIYVIADTKDSAGDYIMRLHALDLTTGQELFGGPTTISASYPGTGTGSSNGIVPFVAKHYVERAALLEVNGVIYTTWASHCDVGAYTSWVIAYSADTLQQTGALNLVPNGSDGGIWMSGAGPAADANGNIFITVGNGTFDTELDANGLPSQGDCGNSFVKISSTPPLTLLDYFTPANTVAQSAIDHDFGSGGPMLLPDVQDANGNTKHLAVSGAKAVDLYVVDRDNLGKFNGKSDSIYQEITSAFIGDVYSKAAYFNGTVYFGASSDAVKAFPVVNALLATTPQSQSGNRFYYPGATPSITANGTNDGIVWGIDNGPSTGTTAVLYAYDASNLATELYDSTQAPGNRDQFNHNKFITPLAINGYVYVGTSNSVAVFGLLPSVTFTTNP